jgi:hypothetical protein
MKKPQTSKTARFKKVIYSGEVMGLGFEVPPVDTFRDGRAPIEEFYRKFSSLQKEGWNLEVICYSQGENYSEGEARPPPLPIIALSSPNPGPEAVWFLSGIHGEEPAGPMALAQNIRYIAKLGKTRPVVLFPLCNPSGYIRNWRYPNKEKYSNGGSAPGFSVGDSDHYLIGDDSKARMEKPTSKEAASLTKHVLKLAKIYNPMVSIDLHEDNLCLRGYIYSHGEKSYDEPLAREIVRVLSYKTDIEMNGETRFHQQIKQGIVGFNPGEKQDGSIDELIASEWIMKGSRRVRGPGAETVLVIETPSKDMALGKRVEAHGEVIRYGCRKYG